MPAITIRLNDTKVKKKLIQVSKDVKDYRKPFKTMGDKLLVFFGKNVFKTQGRDIGERWRPLSAATLKMRKERRGHYKRTSIASNKILIWTGTLQKGFQKTVGKTKLVIKNPVKYFKYHQKATGGPPQRKMLSINPKVIKIVVDELNKYLLKIIKK